MATQSVSDYRFTVNDPGQGELEGSSGTGLSIVYEPLSSNPGVADCAAMSIRLMPGITLGEAHRIASGLQASVKGFCHLEGASPQE
jgi:hypothetical protein